MSPRRGPRAAFQAAFMITLLLGAAARGGAGEAEPSKTRAQLSIGYSLLHEEADGIPKLGWLLAFKEKNSQMGRLTHEVLGYYRDLADRMELLSKQYPAMRLDAKTMSDIEAEERKAIGEDQAKDFAPLIGKSGSDFERETLLMLQSALNEQRHLVAVMIGKESVPALRRFLETTKAQLDERYSKMGALLARRYFTH